MIKVCANFYTFTLNLMIVSIQPNQNPQELKKFDNFTKWIVKRVHELNSNVDAEVFAAFIEGIESPNEVSAVKNDKIDY